MAIQAQFPSCGSQDWMENGCGGLNHGFCLNVQQQKQQLQQQQCHMQQLQNYQQRNQNLCFDNSPLASYNIVKTNSQHPSSMFSSQIMAAYEEKERQDIDRYIRSQNERLRLFLQEQSKQQSALFMKSIESKLLPLLRQKEHEIAQAAKRTLELENFLNKLELENQAWQRQAQEHEAMVMSLNNTIEQLRENSPCCFNNYRAEDAESCCDMNGEEEAAEETEQRNRGSGFVHDDNNKEEMATKTMMMMVCRGCHTRNSCVLLLPCRHLCSCKACEAFLDICPVCQTVKKGSIEALIV